MRQRTFVDDANFGVSSKYYVLHSTIGLPYQMVKHGNFAIQVRSAFVNDELSNGPGDFLEYFDIVPFGERFSTSLGFDNVSLFDLDYGNTATIEVQDKYSASSSVKGIMLFTNGDRGQGNCGASTEDTEMLLFLDENEAHPAPIDTHDDDI